MEFHLMNAKTFLLNLLVAELGFTCKCVSYIAYVSNRYVLLPLIKVAHYAHDHMHFDVFFLLH